ncbi:MAG: phosphate acyltransferase PlsX [Rhodothermales bacterium]|nr:phosphate acyltransferase PlsX [Rhodothermales bacterium]MBO6778788.1 phosphate acyltransferase PlsX [Rhodothermales bacterium]
MSIRVAVDAMGGDHAPSVVVAGCVAAARAASDVQVLLFGPGEELQVLLDAEGSPHNVQVVDAPDVIGMAEAPAAAVKGKPDSSICRGLGAVSAGMADAFVSAGNTGAVMAGSLFILGRLPGVARPAVIGIFPTIKGRCLILDVGTNVDCKPEHLLQFAHMGSIYAERVLKVERPVVGLLNIGEEPGKGNDQAKAAFELLEQAEGLNFRGNIEGRDIMEHAADIIVCDGFVGNVVLKLGESVASVLPRMIGAEMQRQQMGPQEQQAVGKALGGVARQFDYEEYGGVPLLGVGGTVIIGHGGSREKAFQNMVAVAVEAARQDVPGSISAALAS